MSAFPKRETHFFVWGATPETDAFALAEWLGRSFCTGSLRKGGCLLFSHAVAHFARAFARQLAKLAIEAGQGHIAHLVAYFQYRPCVENFTAHWNARLPIISTASASERQR